MTLGTDILREVSIHVQYIRETTALRDTKIPLDS